MCTCASADECVLACVHAAVNVGVQNKLKVCLCMHEFMNKLYWLRTKSNKSVVLEFSACVAGHAIANTTTAAAYVHHQLQQILLQLL